MRSQDEVRTILDAIPAMIWSARPDGSVDFINRRWLDFAGLSTEGAPDRVWTDAIYPDDRNRLADYWRSLLTSGEPGEIEARLRRFDGEYRWFLLRASPLRDELGSVVKWYGTSTDIEDRRRAEDRLQTTELNFRDIVNSIPAFVSTLTSFGEIEFVNQPVLDYFGKTLDELKAWAVSDIVHPDDLPEVVSTWSAAIETGVPNDVQLRLRRADGVYRWHYLRRLPHRDGNGQIIRWYTLHTDIDDRKHAEETVRASELAFRLMVDSIPGLVSTRTPAGNPEFVNRQTLEFFGESLRDLTDWAVLLHPEDRDRIVSLWQRSLETGQPLVAELRARRADGAYKWLQSRVQPLRDENGNVIRWYNLLTDIDDRKRAEHALRISEENLRLMLNSIAGLITTHSPSGELEVANRPFLEYTGKALDELQSDRTILHPDDRDRVLSLWGVSLTTGEPVNAEARLRRADGTYRWFQASVLPLRDSENRIVRWYSLLTDIEERKQAEEALRASERELSLIVETMPGLVWCASLEGELTYMNPRITQYLGASQDELLQGGWANFVHPEDVGRVVEAWSHSVATGQSFEVQGRLRRADGVYRWIHSLSQLAHDSEGRPTRWYGLLIDIDDQKKMAEALRHTQDRLSRATQIATVGELSASIAHEINQPLAAVVASGHACLRFLCAEPPAVAKAREAAESIVRDGKEAGEVVRRIRALFKGTSAEKVLLDVNEVMGEVLQLLNSEIGKRRVTVETDFGKRMPPVLCDRVQLQQLILNLLLNALEAMDPIVDRPRKLLIRTNRDSIDTLVEIRDYGVGLKNQDKVFDAFFTTKEKGMGMGLAICRSIVEAHNGRLWIAPSDGPGTTFCFALPLTSGVVA